MQALTVTPRHQRGIFLQNSRSSLGVFSLRGHSLKKKNIPGDACDVMKIPVVGCYVCEQAVERFSY